MSDDIEDAIKEECGCCIYGAKQTLAAEVLRLRTALTASQERVRWSPIETAPMDGTAVLVCVGGYGDRGDIGAHPMTARYESFHVNAPGKSSWRGLHGHKVFPTHWMPMPEQPALAPKGEGNYPLTT